MTTFKKLPIIKPNVLMSTIWVTTEALIKVSNLRMPRLERRITMLRSTCWPGKLVWRFQVLKPIA